MKKKKQIAIILLFLFNIALYFLGYHVPRTSFYLTFCLYTFLFAAHLAIYKLFDEKWINLKNVLFISLLSRVVLIGAVPQLSDDYNRFIWDGHLVTNQINPYKYTPTEILDNLPQEELPFFNSLFERLNSPDYYSIYPITNQAVFAAAATIGGDSVFWNIIIIRAVLVALEMLTIVFLFLLLQKLRLSPSKIFLYALNPLVLIEITGNLHFEGMMLLFLLITLYCLAKNKDLLSGAFFGLSIAVKITPVILFPAFYSYLRKPWILRFASIAGLVVVLFFFPIVLYGSMRQFLQSIRLYHGVFEFNASVYYVFRHIGILFFHNNPVRVLGPLLSVLTVFVILSSFWKLKDPSVQKLIEGIVFSYLIFYLLNTVVHPWYLIVGLGVSILTNKNYFTAWSYLIFLSYFTYRTSAYTESTLLLFMEYLGLLAVVFYDHRRSIKKLKFNSLR